ncbi:hypothetical protein DL89DRAFT_266436 [Linderina pennispora]|uniref:PH domain-containing protein n=1 Tax=Linderina pennispora TaxID=61395 RepID=A0A1Y1WD25_9FUNG|nr:uncharacterized protein DL89DRAFT_266436 [Linderina pennispora]ORX71433.1 hypothetical protein DL89DRAFT_266436 [Linderina pennispora]
MTRNIDASSIRERLLNSSSATLRPSSGSEVFAGYMHKKSRRGQWQKRLVVLDHDALALYTDKPMFLSNCSFESTPKTAQVSSLHSRYVASPKWYIPVIDICDVSVHGSKGVLVQTSNRVIPLLAKNKSARDMWVEAIEFQRRFVRAQRWSDRSGRGTQQSVAVDLDMFDETDKTIMSAVSSYLLKNGRQSYDGMRAPRPSNDYKGIPAELLASRHFMHQSAFRNSTYI